MTRLFAPYYLIGCNVNYVAEIQKSSISFGTQPHDALIIVHTHTVQNLLLNEGDRARFIIIGCAARPL
jgi:hypothetical protein